MPPCTGKKVEAGGFREWNTENASMSKRVIVVGGGFTGLSAGYKLSRAGWHVTVVEKDDQLGGLAGTFALDGIQIEKFYHHWFTNDRWVMNLIDELGLNERVVIRPTRTGIYYANQVYKLSTPMDLLKFRAIPWSDRIRLGWMTLAARRVKDWRPLEELTAKEWLLKLGGEKVFEVVWGPLLNGKFGPYADKISAVWFWNKLKLRGGSRGKDGSENLAYFRGGFGVLAQAMADKIRDNGGVVQTGVTAEKVREKSGRVVGVSTKAGDMEADVVLATNHLPQYRDLLPDSMPDDYIKQVTRIDYLANVCLVLVTKRSLSNLYWTNVNDPNFPFVGVIEHTNFEPPETYKGKHILYLSRYLPQEDELFGMGKDNLLEYAMPHIKRMFPEFEEQWILDTYLWKARYSQPIVEKHYSRNIPAFQTPLQGLYLSTMAQIYPEDRGTNYAIREGFRAADML